MSDHTHPNPSSVHNVTEVPRDIHDCNTTLNHETRRVWLFLISLLVYVAGLLLNSVVVWVNWSRRCSPNGVLFCTLNMAISDLLSMIVLPFFMLEFTMDYVWVWGEFLCGFLYFVDLTTFYSSSFFLAYLTVERYLAVRRTGPRPWGAAERKRRAMLCGALWVFSVIPAIVQSSHTKLFEFTQPRCFFYSNYYFMFWFAPACIILFQFLCPAVIIITFNFLTLRALRAFPEIQNQGGWSQPWLLHLYSVVFLLCWMPKHIFLLLLQSAFELNLFECKVISTLFFFNAIVSELSSIHCVANPILYNFLSRGFRCNLMADITRLLSKKAVVGVVSENHGNNVELGEERDPLIKTQGRRMTAVPANQIWNLKNGNSPTHDRKRLDPKILYYEGLVSNAEVTNYWCADWDQRKHFIHRMK